MLERFNQQLAKIRHETSRLGKIKQQTKLPRKREHETKRLWDREFSVVKGGLDETQVISFVNDLIRQNRASQATSEESLRSLLKAAVNDAEQTAASIKMRAQTEAETEAAQIISQAKQESQEIRGRAEITGQKETAATISMANRKAEITQIEAKHNALLFLLKAREETEKEVREEYNNAHSRLFSRLQDLLNEGQHIEIELRSKRAELWESKNFELKGYETELLSISEGTEPPSETSAHTEIEIEPPVTQEEKVEEPVQLQEETLEENLEEPVQLQEETL
ncbi:hypothetical protein ACFLUJ_07655, partial [Chloroflexota bacterium]